MPRFSVWTAVQVSNPEHPRTGQAGVVCATNPATPDEVAVRFDSDSIVVLMLVSDLRAL